MGKDNIEIVKRAWCLNNSNIDEPWFHDSDITYYGTRGQAKTSCAIDNACGKTISGEDITFMNIKVRRDKYFDIIIYKGKEIKRYQIAEIERENKIKALPADKMYYVQDRRNYVGNAVLWWGKNSDGYVTDLANAHKYTHEEIIKFNPRETDIIWESSHVEKAVRQYVDMQGLNKTNSY